MPPRVHSVLLFLAMAAPLAVIANVSSKDEAPTESADVSEGKAEPTVPTMQSSHVAMLSNAFAAKRIGAFGYRVTQLVYEVEPGSRCWTIHYELGSAPDGSKPEPAEFDVLLDDSTGKPRFADTWP